MNSDRIVPSALLVAMLGVAAVAWWLLLRPSLEIDASRLDALPLQLAEWRGESLPLESAVERMLDADLNVQRVYRSPRSPSVIWMYFGYYGTRRGGRPEHTPDVCYPSAGWEIEAIREQVVDPERSLRANEYVVSQDGERRLVHFWYRSSRRTGMLGNWSLSLDHLRGRLRDGRADGALVRISTPFDRAGEDAARARLLAFGRALDLQLASHWPEERPGGRDSGDPR